MIPQGPQKSPFPRLDHQTSPKGLDKCFTVWFSNGAFGGNVESHGPPKGPRHKYLRSTAIADAVCLLHDTSGIHMRERPKTIPKWDIDCFV